MARTATLLPLPLDRLLACLWWVLGFSITHTALADVSAFGGSSTQPAEEPQPNAQSPRNSVRWDERWRRVAAWEYATTAVVLGGAFALRVVGPEPPDNFRGGVLFDDTIGKRVVIEDPTLSGNVGTMSDVLYLGSMGYRLIDAALVPSLGYGDYDLATQMLMIDVESFALVAGVLFGTQMFVGRQRPEYDVDCDGTASAELRARCQRHGSRFRSFIAGHPAVAFTAAGLTCTHHAHVPLYGGWGDTLACGLTIGAAAFTGAGRVLAGKHYATDLVLGMALGGFSGWVLPRLLHYGFSGSKELALAPEPQAPSMVLSGLHPWVDQSAYGVNAVGIF